MSYLQVACGGAWEHAVRIDHRAADASSELERVERWRRSTGEIAVEAFFPPDDARPLLGEFIGVRLRGDEGAELLKHVGALAIASPRSPLASQAAFVEALERELGQPLFRSRWAHAEVGVLNACASSARFRWMEARRAPELLAEMAVRAPTLLQPTTTPLALEWAYDAPVEHWRGVPVSAPEGERFRLDAALFASAVSRSG